MIGRGAVMATCLPHYERFTYKRNLQRLAEIDLYESPSSEYSFTLHLTVLAVIAEPYRHITRFESQDLAASYPQVKGLYKNQKDCLKAAAAFLSMIVTN